jgi:hypothetical protein
MAQIDRVREAMRRQPFRPFVLRLVDGTAYTVNHPDWVSIPPVRHPREVIYFAVGANPEEYDTHWIDLNLVAEVIVPSGTAAGGAAAKTKGNGE